MSRKVHILRATAWPRFLSWICDVASYPTSNSPKQELVKAGTALAGTLLWDDESRRDDIYRTFKVAWAWRDSHAYPMRLLRYDLAGKVRKAKASAITAARMKRMSSIRKKLRRLTTTLLQIDDLGGCRAIIDSMDHLNALVDVYRSADMLHEKKRDRSYIEKPKNSGYRSHHLVYAFAASEQAEEIYNGRRIEVQLRTRLQHAWATAVEAVGLALDQDLKGGEGNADWLRLFALMSSEFAEAEGCPLLPNAPDRPARIAELKDLDGRLDAVATLDSWNRAINQTENLVTDARYYQIKYDNEKKTVQVRGFNNADWANSHSLAEENSSITTVMVEVDKVENLREAYPNYFLDVSLFAENLERALKGQKLLLRGRDAGEDEEPAAPVAWTGPTDYSWVSDWKGRRRV
jgi:Region found in RelA / SpoT proteins